MHSSAIVIQYAFTKEETKIISFLLKWLWEEEEVEVEAELHYILKTETVENVLPDSRKKLKTETQIQT